jgi:hypothetical protein
MWEIQIIFNEQNTTGQNALFELLISKLEVGAVTKYGVM